MINKIIYILLLSISFTQIQNMINDYFFDEAKDNVEEVFGELEETDEDEEDEEEESED